MAFLSPRIWLLICKFSFSGLIHFLSEVFRIGSHWLWGDNGCLSSWLDVCWGQVYSLRLTMVGGFRPQKLASTKVRGQGFCFLKYTRACLLASYYTVSTNFWQQMGGGIGLKAVQGQDCRASWRDWAGAGGVVTVAEGLGQTLPVWKPGISKGRRGTVHAVGVGTRVTPPPSHYCCHLKTRAAACVHADLYTQRNQLCVLISFPEGTALFRCLHKFQQVFWHVVAQMEGKALGIQKSYDLTESFLSVRLRFHLKYVVTFDLTLFVL